MKAELIIGIITLLVAIATLVVSYITYRYARKSDEKRKADELQRIQDEYDALMNSVRCPMTAEQREFQKRKYILEKGLKRR